MWENRVIQRELREPERDIFLVLYADRYWAGGQGEGVTSELSEKKKFKKFLVKEG